MPVIPPLDIELGNVTEHNLQQLKTLNMVALPVRYSEKFYRDLLANSPPEYLKFVFWNGFAIASVCSRLENHPEHPDFKKIYIMTIGVIPAYRRRGVASKLLGHVMDNAARDQRVLEVYLHVQTSNEEARLFYLSHGFEQTGTIENYYKRIEPPHCYVLRKIIREPSISTPDAESKADPTP